MRTLLIFALLIIAAALSARQKHDYTTIIPSEWVLPKTDTLDYAFDTYSGSNALLLKRKFGNSRSASVAYPGALNFKDGIIELDIASPGGGNGFVGFAFRIKDAHHYETVYFRPGSSGKVNAVQYMPEKKAEFDWWDYEADKYQSKAVLPLTNWFHVKAIVKGRILTVFVNHQPVPVMAYKNLDPTLKSGSVGFWLGNCASGAYKNLVVTNL